MQNEESQVRPRGVLVVGASGGLGQSVSERLAADGYSLFLSYRSRQTEAQALAERLAPLTKVQSVQLDVVDRTSISRVRQLIEESGLPLHGIVYASGARIAQPLVADVSGDEWRAVIETELMGFANLASAFIPLFRKQRSGAFVNIVTFANYGYTVGDALSSVPKAGVESMIKSIALEEGRNGIRANCVAPGIINAGQGAEFQHKLYSAEVWERQERRVPLRRFGEAAEVAEAVAFLISDKASYITGSTLLVDGGLHL